MGRGKKAQGSSRTRRRHAAAQARFVLPPACVTPQGMSTRAHEVYYLREVLGLTYAEVGRSLGMASSGTIARLCRAVTALLAAQKGVLGAGAYQALLAGVRGGVGQPGETLEKVQESPPRHKANSMHFQRRQQQQQQQQQQQYKERLRHQHQRLQWQQQQRQQQHQERQQQHQEPLESRD